MAKKTNVEKLLNQVKKVGGMTRKEMCQYLLKLNGSGAHTYGYFNSDRGLYGSTLYSTTDRKGVLEKFCAKKNGKWVVTKKIKGPFTEAR